jgi:hypothetical protein
MGNVLFNENGFHYLGFHEALQGRYFDKFMAARFSGILRRRDPTGHPAYWVAPPSGGGL